jgi:hypothetical protein
MIDMDYGEEDMEQLLQQMDEITTYQAQVTQDTIALVKEAIRIIEADIQAESPIYNIKLDADVTQRKIEIRITARPPRSLTNIDREMMDAVLDAAEARVGEEIAQILGGTE